MTATPEELDRCVRCGLCLQACPTFALTGMEQYSPRGRLALLRDPDGTAALSPAVSESLDTCLGCLACQDVCPAGVPYGRILDEARETIRPRRRPVKWLAETILLWAVSERWRLSILSMLLYPLQKVRLLFGPLRGLPPLRLANLFARMGTNYVPPEGVTERGQVVLFAGCVQDAWFRDVHWALVRVMTAAGYRVRVPHAQVCCGALHAHAGRGRAARRLARRNIAPLSQFSGPVVTDSSGCGARLKEYGHVIEEGAELADRVRDWSEVLTPDDIAALSPRPPEGLRRIAVHDPCHQRFAQGISSGPKALLAAAGYEVVELGDSGRCCGAAGTYALHNPEWAEPLRESKLEACAAADADAVAVANPGCQLWLAGTRGAPPMLHPVQLLALALVGDD